MNELKRITKCESIAKMTPDEVKIMILQQRINKAIEYINEYQNIKAHKLELNENGFKDIVDFGFKENLLYILGGETNV